ncbi:MAG: hypothetical protein WA741_04935 [Candidatus Sulfotelmatobacter sp.]
MQVPKVGAILPGGQLMHISLDTCDREAAETKATEITLSLNAASEAKPGVAGQPLPKKSRAGSRLATSSPISLEFPPSTSLLIVPEAFGRCKAISFVSNHEGPEPVGFLVHFTIDVSSRWRGQVEIGLGRRAHRIEQSADVHLGVGFTAKVPAPTAFAASEFQR